MDLSSQWITQGNDLGMLPPMGVNATKNGGGNYLNYPFPNDPVAQARAAALNSITALTEPTGGYSNFNDSYPLGFQTDTLYYDLSVCVQVTNVYNRWVEIMVQSHGHTVCVSDLRKPDANSNPPQATCGLDLLYSCRESGNVVSGNGFTDNLQLQFYCTGVSCDTDDYKFYWRIMARFAPMSLCSPIPSM